MAIAAITHGVVPASSRVRSSAIALGRAALRNKSFEEVRHYERGMWIVVAIFGALVGVVLGLALYSHHSSSVADDVMMAIIFGIVFPSELLASRRMRLNTALLIQDPLPSAVVGR
jgi:hypothetical protein